MDRIWQWAWDRFKARYSWAVYAVGIPLMLLTYLFWLLLIVAVQGSGRYVEAAVVAVVGAPVSWYVAVLPGMGRARVVERWAAGRDTDRARWTPRIPWLGGRSFGRWRSTLCGPGCYPSLSPALPGRVGRNASSTEFWAS